MAQRITEIQLNNFKFFSDNSAPINVDGKHLLIYGENGSGKSSIFWGLYTLLECANKDDDDIKKYFQKNNKDTLVNIYATPGANDNCNSFVSVKLDDGSVFKISLIDTSINSDLTAKKSNYVSDFINYKFISKTHDFKHSDEINLFPMFERFILPYVKFSPVKYWKKKRDGSFEELETENASEIWNFVKNGPLKNLVATSGKFRYPLRREPQFKDYLNIVNGFEQQLRQLLTFINTEGNPILNSNFDANFTYNLSLKIKVTAQKNSFYLTQQRFQYPEYQILLKVPTYYGLNDVINRPHSFLNEAKLTGIGLSMRLAVLKRRADDAKIKALVLDDLLISLDMIHREKMIELITGIYSIDYQILYFTHDRNFFEMMRDNVKKKGEEQNWKYLEIVETDVSGTKTCKISDSKSYLEKAYKYCFTDGDYETAGNWLRKEAEKFCKIFLPPKLQIDNEGNILELNGLIINALSYARTNGLDLTYFNRLDSHRKFVFNVLSHDNYDAPRFRTEVERCFETFNNLWQLKYKIVLNADSHLEFEMNDNSFLWRAEFIVHDDLRLIKESGNDSILSKVKMSYKIFKNGTLYKADYDYISLKSFYDRWYNNSDKTLNSDFWEEVKISGSGNYLKTIREF